MKVCSIAIISVIESYVLLPTGPACDGKDHEGMLVRQRWGSPHCAAREEVAIPAESTRGHQDIEQQLLIFTLPIHSLHSSRGVSEGATSSGGLLQSGISRDQKQLVLFPVVHEKICPSCKTIPNNLNRESVTHASTGESSN